ncbi:hypothetical protein JCM11641_001001 [Rhodosporidiobolus odoratus]
MPSEGRRAATKSQGFKRAPRGANKYVAFGCFGDEGEVYCYCDNDPRIEAVLRTTRTNKNGNKGRQFFACDSPAGDCGFFLWADEVIEKGGKDPFQAGAGAVVPYTSGSSSHSGHTLDKTESDDGWEDASHLLFRRSPSPRPSRTVGGRRLLESPSSDLAAEKQKTKKRTQVADTTPSQKRSRRRSPSPDWPEELADDNQLEPHLEHDVARLRRENAALQRQLRDAERKTDKVQKANEVLQEENDQLNKQIYPGNSLVLDVPW